MDNKIGKDCKIYKDIFMRDAIIGDNSIIADDCFVSNCNIGKHCRIERRNVLINSEIGNYSYTGYNTVIKKTRVGKFCSISWNVSIGGANHDYKKLTTHPFPFRNEWGIQDGKEEFESFSNELIIGNDVWVASNACILRGVRIGDGAVIAAGAVVTHDVPPYEIWGGIPARKIGQRFDNKTIDKVLELKWWDLPIDFLSKNIEYFKKEVTVESIENLIKYGRANGKNKCD